MKGILFKVSTTNFDDTVKSIEETFDIFDVEGWKEVKESKDFDNLSDFLTAMDVDNEVFVLPKK